MHEMKMIERMDDGFERWSCEECGREFLMKWPPNYEKVIISTGNEMIDHCGIRQDAGTSPLFAIVTLNVDSTNIDHDDISRLVDGIEF